LTAGPERRSNLVLIFPQSVVSTKTPAVEAEPLVPPELVSGRAALTSHRMLSIPNELRTGIAM
jgi:hypothetical protein